MGARAMSAHADPVAAALVRADRQVEVATDALTRIAEKGLVTGVAPEWTCPCCRRSQSFQGRCGNRECPASIANTALDDMRRAS